MKRVLNFIDGQFRPPCSGRYLPNVNPATGGVIGESAESGPEDVDAAVVAEDEEDVGLVGRGGLRLQAKAAEAQIRSVRAKVDETISQRLAAQRESLAKQMGEAVNAEKVKAFEEKTTVTWEGGELRPAAPPGGNANTSSVTISGEPHVSGAWNRASVRRAGAAPLAERTVAVRPRRASTASNGRRPSESVSRPLPVRSLYRSRAKRSLETNTCASPPRLQPRAAC